MTIPATALSDGAATADAAPARLDDVLAPVSDGDLQLATPGGSWTVAQERLRQDPELRSRDALPPEA